MTNNKKQILLLGCGNSRVRKIYLPSQPSTFDESQEALTTIDIDPLCSPTHLHDLNILPWPLPSSFFSEIHCYEVLEHLGRQGDYHSFFAHFTEIHRLLVPGGFFFCTCPSYTSMWAWGDPGHTRLITSGTLAFLSQSQYSLQVGTTPMTDYRSIYKADFTTLHCQETPSQLIFVLQAVK